MATKVDRLLERLDKLNNKAAVLQNVIKSVSKSLAQQLVVDELKKLKTISYTTEGFSIVISIACKRAFYCDYPDLFPGIFVSGDDSIGFYLSGNPKYIKDFLDKYHITVKKSKKMSSRIEELIKTLIGIKELEK